MSEIKKFRTPHTAKIILFTVAYSAITFVNLKLTAGDSFLSPIAVASGFALGAALIFGTEFFASVAAGAFIANILFLLDKENLSAGTIISLSLFQSLRRTFETFLAYYILKKFNATNILGRTREFTVFFVCALVVGLISSGISVAGMFFINVLEQKDLLSAWFVSYPSIVTGLLVVTPALYAWKQTSNEEKIKTEKKAVTLSLFAALAICATFVFDFWPLQFSSNAKVYLLFPILIFCGLKLNHKQCSVAALLVAFIATLATFSEQGPLYSANLHESFISLQLFLWVCPLIMMFLATTIKKRKLTEMHLTEIKNSLEDKIEQRTRELRYQEEFLKESNRQLLIKTRELERSNREFQNFAHIASHDMQEPLRTISSYLQILESRYKDKLDQDGMVIMNYTIDGARRMQSLIRDLLSYSSVESKGKEFEEIDLNVVTEIVTRNLQSTINESGAIIRCSPFIPAVVADSSQLIQLFQNLIDNAIKYRSTATPEITINAVEQTNGWLITIRDNGIGIDKKFLDRIFIIFQRLHTRDKYPGTGIGLAICKKIIERHGGKIWAESEPGNGTTFYFTLETRNKVRVSSPLHALESAC